MKTNFIPSFEEEHLYWSAGLRHVIGIDEVGVGAFAGPVVIAGVIFDTKCASYFHDSTHELYELLHKIHDSKKLLPKVRDMLSPLIQNACLFYAISEISVSVINTIGIRKATLQGMQQVIDSLQGKIFPEKPAILVDGYAIPFLSHQQKALVKGDQKSISIAAASIIAKVYRDTIMQKLAKDHPQYHFEKNKGYGTKDHRDAIRDHGLSQLHRSSFNLYKFL